MRHVTVLCQQATTEAPVLVASQVAVANNPWSRLKGLMGQAALAEDTGLLLQPCNSIHSFFMRFTFDAVFLDKTNTIVGLVHAMPPWRVSKLYPNAKATLELPAGSIERLKLALGQTLRQQERPAGKQ
jgi:uncharacterized protein